MMGLIITILIIIIIITTATTPELGVEPVLCYMRAVTFFVGVPIAHQSLVKVLRQTETTQRNPDDQHQSRQSGVVCGVL